MNRFKKLLYLTLTVFFSMILVACGEEIPDMSQNETEDVAASEFDVDTSDNDTLVIGMSNAPSSQNPFFSPGASEVWTMNFFYETLLNQVSATEFVPRLGEFETEDNQTFTIKLNPDAMWTDGEPVTADDVAFTLNTIAHPDTLITVGAKIAMLEGTDEGGKMAEGTDALPGLEVIDDHTLQVRTKVPVDINYISEQLGAGVRIAPEHVFADIPKAEIHNSEPATHPTVFNGAYKFVEYEEENYLYMTANEDYYRGAPKIKDIYVRVLSNEAMVTELQSGGIHMVSQGGFGDVPHQDIPMISEVENLVIEESSSPNVQYLYMNNESPRFEDVRVRQALAYALDFDMAVENLLLGSGEVLASPYSSANESYKADDLKPYPYDPELARELLEEANFDFSQPVELGVPTGNTIREQMGDLVEQWLEAVGIEVNQSRYDFATWSNYLREGDYDIGLYGIAHTYEPDLSSLVGTGGSNNHARYSSEEMDTLLARGAEIVEAKDRYPVYLEVQELFKEDAPIIPLYSEAVYSVQVNNLQGGVDPFFPATLVDVHEWELTE